jgi:undecaprenyl-diphosphatase
VNSLEAVLLGLIQGLFMFVPVSSTSHLALAQTWLIERGSSMPAPESADMVLFDLIVHVGTLVSIVVVMRAGLKELGAGVRDDLLSGRIREGGLGLSTAVSTRLVMLGLLTVAVTGVVGLGVRSGVEQVFANPVTIAAALIGTGTMLWWTDAIQPGRGGRWLRFDWRGPAQVNVAVAVAVGLAQAAALTPGLSRSGTTIFVALLLGVRRKLAARYSFYVAIPTILGATAHQSLSLAGEGGTTLSVSALVLGFVTAAVVGAGALWLVLRLLEQSRFRIFALYVWALAAFVLLTETGLTLPVQVR